MTNAIFTVMGGIGLIIVGYVIGRSDERLYTIPPQRKPLTEWKPIDTAPKDKQLLLAAEFAGPNDWRIKTGYYSSELKEWRVWGASWIPTRWMHLTESPSIEAAHDKAGT